MQLLTSTHWCNKTWRALIIDYELWSMSLWLWVSHSVILFSCFDLDGCCSRRLCVCISALTRGAAWNWLTFLFAISVAVNAQSAIFAITLIWFGEFRGVDAHERASKSTSSVWANHKRWRFFFLYLFYLSCIANAFFLWIRRRHTTYQKRNKVKQYTYMAPTYKASRSSSKWNVR